MNPRYPLVAARALHRCEYCLAPEVIFNFPFEVEHVVPMAKGGDSEITNLALSCRSCNLYKGVQVKMYDPSMGVEVHLFHPRQDTWLEHFQVSEAGVMIGLTPIGRVTVTALQMNHGTQLLARQQWMRLGIYP